MLIDDIFNLPGIQCIEPVFAELTEDYYTEEMLSIPAEEARLLIDENEYPIALALREKTSWLAGSFVCRPPSRAVLSKFEESGGDIYQENASLYLDGLREYFSLKLLSEVPQATEDTRPERKGMVASLITDTWGSLDGATCIDCCCGSGVISEAIRDCGGNPCGYDNDPALIALGLHSKRLYPRQVMHIDASRATDYIAPVRYGVGCMLGDITAFNAGMWENIVSELLVLSEQTVITTATEPEIQRVKEWCSSQGRTCEIIENDRDPIYDRWVCISSL
ncbi:hypothetical protein L1S32_04880 [Methanogenium sp. S4BF]|uniref:hypothetical protein n=1 Tax=Methanogenium sp. S4BF TaxID=1789226 RepID=UPI00241605A1|nr:hypothetical protein [Methanogenium sp. S4BF]WFN35448.1 hypothetical protein L1S32_04880 [Methanogenium sp. S4BF]